MTQGVQFALGKASFPPEWSVPVKVRKKTRPYATPFFDRSPSLHNTCLWPLSVIEGIKPSVSSTPTATSRLESKDQSCPENRRSLDLLHERAIPELQFPAVDVSRILPKLRMLRRVIERLPQRVEIWDGEAQSTVYVETLECGHKLTRYTLIDPERTYPAKRRHCVTCADLQITVKKPAAPQLSRKKRGIA